jgi:hypothetical protein
MCLPAIKNNDDVTPFPIQPAKIVPCSIDSDISTRFFAHVLFVALMMDAVRISETSVCFDTTRLSIERSCHLLRDLLKLALDTVKF